MKPNLSCFNSFLQKSKMFFSSSLIPSYHSNLTELKYSVFILLFWLLKRPTAKYAFILQKEDHYGRGGEHKQRGFIHSMYIAHF